MFFRKSLAVTAALAAVSRAQVLGGERTHLVEELEPSSWIDPEHGGAHSEHVSSAIPSQTHIHPSPSSRPSRRITYADMYSHPKKKFLFGNVGVLDIEIDKMQLDSDNVLILPFASRNYLCKIPTDSDLHNYDVYADRKSAEEKRAAANKAVKMVQPMSSKCLQHVQGWWTYEFCHGQKIIQYRDFTIKAKSGNGNIKKRMEYLLGIYNPSQIPVGFFGDKNAAGIAGSELVEGEESGRRYLRMWYGDGQLCDGRPRMVEVQFSCCPTEHVANVDETAICHYVMQIHTPRVCKDPIFKANRDAGYPKQSDLMKSIICEPIMTLDELRFNYASRSKPDDLEKFRTISTQGMLSQSCLSPLECNIPKTTTEAEGGKNSDDETGGLEGTSADLLAGAAAAGVLPFYDKNALGILEDRLADGEYDYEYDGDEGGDFVDDHHEGHGYGGLAGHTGSIFSGASSKSDEETSPDAVDAEMARAEIEAKRALYAKEFAEALEIEMDEARLSLWEILTARQTTDADGKVSDGLKNEKSSLLREALEETVEKYPIVESSDDKEEKGE
ncbi:Protein OS-9 [Phlyctochytrium planicorne]|nr:Protein OS-9 [Phlyctochytrium planicorne]